MHNYRAYQRILGATPIFMQKYLTLACMKRLKEIILLCGMNNASKAMYHFANPQITRFDHSLNDAKIIWLLKKDKKAALAALFHDGSSPTWCHVVDYMNKDYLLQESTEEKTEEILASDETLQEYLKMDGIKLEEIVDHKKYSLCDLPRPSLCSDRVDNTISTAFAWMGSVSLNEAKLIIDALDIGINENNEEEICLKNYEAADILIRLNNEINVLTHSKEDTYMMLTASAILKRCINLEYVTYDALFKISEKELLKIIKRHLVHDATLADLWHTYTSATTVPDLEIPPIKDKILKPLVNGVRYTGNK